jgi:PAS domain-containing protein
MKLSIKITLLIISFAVVFGASFIYISSGLIRDRLYTSQDQWIETLVHAISEGIALNTINGDVLEVREKLQRIVQNDIALEYAYVTDFQGRIFAHTFEKGFPRALLNQHKENKLISEKHKHASERHLPPDELHTLQPIKTYHGEILDVAYPLINGLSSHLHLGVNQIETISLIQDTNTEIILLVLFLTLIGSIITIFFARRITAPLHQLAQNIQLYGKGELSKPIHLEKSSQEVRELSNTFTTMIEDRKKLKASLVEQDMIYRRLLESTTAIPWELDLDTWQFTYIGKQITNTFNYPIEKWYTENFWLDHIYSGDRENVIAYCKSETALGHNHELEYRMINTDKQIVWIREDVTIIFQDEQAVRLQGFMFDITLRKQAELENQQYKKLLHQKQSTFFEWAKSKDLDLQHALHRATELSAESLQTDRVSIWLYNEKHTAIICEDLCY